MAEQILTCDDYDGTGISKYNHQSVFPAANGDLLCTTCKVYLSPESFGVDKQHKLRGRKYKCKSCCNKYRKENYNAEETYYYFMFKRYGLTRKEIDLMRFNQGYACALCYKDEEDNMFEKLYVDHIHDSGVNRELLCNDCNQLVKSENPELLRRAAEYIERHRE